ncbi:hypothetical protein FM106_16270 [Brachybacterium faecium]|nr:hypothetical protein FM106_16270 [Brachybacterium faecium]
MLPAPPQRPLRLVGPRARWRAPRRRGGAGGAGPAGQAW